MRLLSAVIFLICTQAYGMGKAGPKYLMVSLGDSITAGTFADTSMILNQEPPLGPWDPTRLSSLSSIGVDIPFLFENKATLSWSSGESIQSHFIHLKNYLALTDPDGVLTVANFSYPGDETKNLPGQVDRLLSEYASGGYQSLKYVTILIGADDACIQAPTINTRVNLEVAFARIAQISQSERIKVFVALLPPIPELGRDEIRYHNTLGYFTCEYIRNKVIKECNPVLYSNNTDDFLAKMADIDERNNQIRQAVENAAAQFKNLDLFIGKTLEHHNLALEYLAADCFHPNRSGQEQLSEKLWQEQPWFK